MTARIANAEHACAVLEDVSLSYGKMRALRGVDLAVPPGCLAGLIGPDGVGKSSLLSLIAGARAVQTGRILVLGGDMADAAHRRATCPRIAFMPQGLGKNLYPTLSVHENVDFFGRLFGHAQAERERRIAELLRQTGLDPFADRPAGKLSGGMRQKLGLCCALIHDPELLVLDEPTTGVDPLSRRQFWELIASIRIGQPDMSVIVATAYMEEAARFDWIAAMNAGEVLAFGAPADVLEQTKTTSLDDAFIALLPEKERRQHRPVQSPPRAAAEAETVAIEAQALSVRFGSFTAVDNVSFRIGRGEIFGFLGSNGCGKTTTMKVLTGLLPASAGEAFLFGRPVDPRDMETRRDVGYMSQSFSLYSELTVRQNLDLHARLFDMTAEEIPARVAEIARRFELDDVMDVLPPALPLGVRQRLSLAVAIIHGPNLLILDEPTSGVDPVARDKLWSILIDLARNEGVTIFISTHFMSEAERCDRISLMHAGKVLVTGTPQAIAAACGVATLEQAFIAHLERAIGETPRLQTPAAAAPEHEASRTVAAPAAWLGRWFSLRRLMSYSRREALELLRDPMRATLALVGSVILMFVLGYGISMDLDNLSFAALDQDRTPASRDYVQQISGSRYFIEHAPILDYADMDRRLRNGELSLALEIPSGFGRDVAARRTPEVRAWIDGAMPIRAEVAGAYVEGMQAHWAVTQIRERVGHVPESLFEIQTRFRYNPNIESLISMVPSVIPLLLLMIPAMLTALSVVREKELGSIVNLYVTPVTKLEFLVGKQLPYIALAMVNFLLLTAAALFVFQVPFTGSFLAYALGAFFYICSATAMGLLISSALNSQIAALFGTAILTLIPAVQFSGMIDPVSSLRGAGAFIGAIYPTTHFIVISRGAFSKSLGFVDMWDALAPLLISAPALILLSAALLRKQER